ncbi:hypothetical protein E8E14_001567 [Neopestalotiopsis sp. 37M]|nr:hypothetical protein E8E14_001567 [Neopestalotiopsis sp. 37M]
MPPGPLLIPPSDPAAEYVPPPDVLAALEQTSEGCDVEIPGPVQRAARLSDSRILRGLLKAGFPATNYIVGPLNNPWESALTNAILACLPTNAKLLLEHGANPNGFPDWCFLNASSRFIRGRPSELTLTGGCHLLNRADVLSNLQRSDDDTDLAISQAAALTHAELKLRRTSRARFWAEVDFPMTDFPTNNPLSSLAAATAVGDELLYLQLIEHGADESAWRGHGILNDQAAGVPSLWAVAPPLWVAVGNQNQDMLRFLLERGHKPDLFPSSLVTRSWNALSYAVVTKWRAGFDMMAPVAPLAHMSLITPVYECHLVHFAVATLDLDWIKHVLGRYGGTEDSARHGIPKTALGHNLLHVASLPLNDTFLNMHSPQCYMSIHDFRTLDTVWMPLQLRTTAPASSGRRARGARGSLSSRGPGFSDVSPDQEKEQEDTIRYLLGILPKEELRDQDIHGNTPLHYLASVRNPNHSLINWLKEQSAGEAAWTMTNSWGFSAQHLSESGEAARSDWNKTHMPFWRHG